MSVYKIHIKSFKKWQKPTESRMWLAMDKGFFFDRKVRAARRQCADAPECFVSLWPEADEDGNIEFSASALKSYWMEVLCVESNRFKVEKRLEALSNAGLIEFQMVPNDVLNGSQCGSNGVLNESQRVLEAPKTSVAVKSNNKQTKQTNKQTEESPLFRQFYDELYPRRENRPDAWKAWQQIAADGMATEIFAGIEKWRAAGKFREMKFIPMPGPFLRGRRWEDDVMPGADESAIPGTDAFKKRFIC